MTIADNIRDDGFFIIKNFFSDEASSLVKKDILDCFEKVNENSFAVTENGVIENEPGGGFPQGKNVRIMPSSYEVIPNIVKQVFESEIVNTTIDEYYGQSCKRFLQVFASWEKRVVTNENLGRHSWLHADPYAALKFAFFPFGATKDNGAPMVVPKSRAEGKIIREQFMSRGPRGIQGGIAHRMVDFQQYCPQLITRNEDEAVHAEVSPRDLLVLDTDTYHAGGKIVEENKQRIAVYIHNRP